jgi:hypothetical protein
VPDDRLCFVQFMHPGVEHQPDSDAHISWNRRQHRRKFLNGHGNLFDGDVLRNSQFSFWGEWEPESRVLAEYKRSNRRLPRYLFEPYYEIPDSYVSLQNTDPFVFGERFYYTGCLQHTRRGPTQLRNLAVGSVVLFGSYMESRFALDTVLVVGDFVDHERTSYELLLRDRLSQTYWDVTVRPWYHNATDPDRSYRLYFGATYREPANGMYSFTPCLPSSGAPRPFERPLLHLPGIVNPALKQGKKLNPQPDLPEVRKLWERVVDQVLDDDLALAVGIDLPPLKP